MAPGTELPSRTRGLLFLSAVVVTTSALVLRFYDYDGHDFINNVWAPTRALLDGLNPYDADAVDYYRRYQVPIVAALYTPASLFIFAPVAWLPTSLAAAVIAAVSVAMMWGGVLLLIPPRTAGHCIVAAGAGALLLLSSAADHTIELGQLSAFAFGGLALVTASLRRDADAAWLPAIGTLLISLKPQSGIPMLLALGLLRRWSVLVRSIVLIAAASLPATTLLVLTQGGADAFRTLGQNPSVFWTLPTNDLAQPANLRIDLLGVISHLNGPSLNGFGWLATALAASTALFFMALRIGRRFDPRVETSPAGVTLLGLYVSTSLYHLTYDQLLLYAGPVMAVGAVADGKTAQRSSGWLIAGAIVLAAAGVLFRPGVRLQLVDWGASALLVHRAWVVTPTVVTLFVVSALTLRWWGGLRLRGRRLKAAEAL